MTRGPLTYLKAIVYFASLQHVTAQRTAVIDDKILQQLVEHSPDAVTTQKAKRKDADAIFDLARLSKDKELSNRVLHILADYQEHPHTMSQVALAFHYYKNRQDKHSALKYFVKAGEGKDDEAGDGTRQLALHNAGRVAAELKLWGPALKYSRRAAAFQPVTDQKVAAASLKEWDDISKQVATQDLSIEQAGELFLLAHIDGFPRDDDDDDEDKKIYNLWTTAIQASQRFNQTFTQSAGISIDLVALETAVINFRATWELSKARVSRLQLHLLLKLSNFALAYLAGFTEKYLPMAAAHAEVYARTPYCYGAFATSEDDSSCFNEAAALAANYYRRANDADGVQRAMELGNSHPDALTHWLVDDQTPRVFHPSLTSKPLWDTSEFQLASTLQIVYAKHSAKIASELTALKADFATAPSKHDATVEVGIAGELVERTNLTVDWQRIQSTPSMIIRATTSTASELGKHLEVHTLYDGVEWNKAACDAMPTICRTLQKHERRLCSEKTTVGSSVIKQCGTNNVVTLTKIPSGVRIVPRCGATNVGLTLHLCIKGCAGLGLTFKDNIIDYESNSTTQVVIADDSFVHNFANEANADAYLLTARVRHPDAATKL